MDLTFSNNQPQGAILASFIASLTANQPVSGVTLATTKAAPDAGANERLSLVIKALVDAGKPQPAASRQVVEALNENDRRQLLEVGLKAEDYDEVVFFELNGGA